MSGSPIADYVLPNPERIGQLPDAAFGLDGYFEDVHTSDYHLSVFVVNTKVSHVCDLVPGMTAETRGDRLKRLREAKGLTQAQVAAVAGIKQSAIGNIESNIRGYGPGVVEIATLLGTTPAYLRMKTDDDGGAVIKELQPSMPQVSHALLIQQLGAMLENTPETNRKMIATLLSDLAINPKNARELANLFATLVRKDTAGSEVERRQIPFRR